MPRPGRFRRRLAAPAPLILLLALGPVGGGCGWVRHLRPAPDAELERRADVIYARHGDLALGADLYLPPGPGPHPGVLLVHGGSWQRGDKDQMSGIGERLAAGGFVAVSVDYRLAPEFRFPAPVEDLSAALGWMREHADALRLDPGRIAGFGYSAGGHLVSLLATTERGALQAAVAGGAPTDLRAFPHGGTFERFLGASADEDPALYARASPIEQVSPDDPPMFLYHGRGDWIVDVEQARRMAERLRGVGVPVELVETSLGHSGTFLFDGEEVERAMDFLRRWLGPGPPGRTAGTGDGPDPGGAAPGGAGAAAAGSQG